MTEKAPVILDVDTGVDDALALVLASRLPRLDLVGVTTVAGNVGVGHTTENTLRVLHAAGAGSIPIHRGMSGPLVRPFRDAAEFHGANGLGGVELPEAPGPPAAGSAPDFIVRTALDRAGEITLICVGPLTNLATALLLEPRLPELVARVVVMGGAFQTPGNVSPWAEFNIWADPEAAAAVARSALPLTFVGLDVTHQTLLDRSDWERLGASGDPVHRMMGSILERSFVARGAAHFPLHDPLAVAVAVAPELVRTEAWSVEVDVSAWSSLGQTRLASDPHAPRHQVALEVDVAMFRRLFFQTLDLATG